MNLEGMRKNSQSKQGIFTTAGNVVSDTISVVGQASNAINTATRALHKTVQAVELVIDEVQINQKLDMVAGLTARGLDMQTAVSIYNQQVEPCHQIQYDTQSSNQQ